MWTTGPPHKGNFFEKYLLILLLKKSALIVDYSFNFNIIDIIDLTLILVLPKLSTDFHYSHLHPFNTFILFPGVLER